MQQKKTNSLKKIQPKKQQKMSSVTHEGSTALKNDGSGSDGRGEEIIMAHTFFSFSNMQSYNGELI